MTVLARDGILLSETKTAEKYACSLSFKLKPILSKTLRQNNRLNLE